MRILAIETSCDETAISIVDFFGMDWSTLRENRDIEGKVLSHLISSQIEQHREWGGVVPNIARREHQLALVPLLKQALTEAKLFSPQNEHPDKLEYVGMLERILEREPELLASCKDFLSTIHIPDIDAIAVTTGPGLEPALWVGLNFAKAISLAWNKPLVPVNHMEGHFFSSLLTQEANRFTIPKFNFPVLGLLISGGHTELLLMHDFQKYELLGATRDDAVGEAFDKVARLMDLPYPGGPEISKLAELFSTTDNQQSTIHCSLPRPMLKSDDLDFSFSGLKTAVRYYIESLPKPLAQEQKIAVAHEFEEAVTEVIVTKTLKALTASRAETFVVGGGVIANTKIRKELQNKISDAFPETSIHIPSQTLTTDNATMIAIAAFFCITQGQTIEPKLGPLLAVRANGNLSLHS